EEIDLRPTMGDVKRAGYVEEPQDDSAPLLPKYDPVTGELVEPIKVAPMAKQRAEAIPMARRVVNYASGQQLSSHHSASRVLLELFQPPNLIVMTFILIAHVIWEGLLVVCSMFLIFLPVLFLATGMFFAHYAIVIEEVGVEERDELPRPLRHGELGADLWKPFIHFIGAFILCYWPAILAVGRLADSPMRWPVFFALMVVGTIFLPAMLLTLTTSGSLWNLRPDRVVGVALRCGHRYIVAVLLFPVITLIYMVGALGSHVVVLRHAVPKPGVQTWLGMPMVVYPLLVIGVYLMHYFCWYLGLMYRDFHDQFPWVLQRHIPTRVLERSKPT
ncbi:MAG TPA: hypothetical protein VG722_00275, partial [Tepidisphaeraceae bacterium]|nr:hypothetical protein [Tepidisphaeraceae bacterium]